MEGNKGVFGRLYGVWEGIKMRIIMLKRINIGNRNLQGKYEIAGIVIADKSGGMIIEQRK